MNAGSHRVISAIPSRHNSTANTWIKGDGAPLARTIPLTAADRLFSAPVYKIRDLLTMFAPTDTCARAACPCTRSPINALHRGEGPFRRRRPSPRDPAEIFYSRRFLRADISRIDRPRRGCSHGADRKGPTLRPRGPRTRGNLDHRSPTVASRSFLRVSSCFSSARIKIRSGLEQR